MKHPTEFAAGLYTFAGMSWALTKTGTRKVHECWMGSGTIPKGTRVYKPITNGKNRMRRIRQSAMEGPK